MVSFGSKALPLRRRKDHSITENSVISREDGACTQGRRTTRMGRRATKKHGSSDGSLQSKGASGSIPDKTMKDKKSSKNQDFSEPETSYVRNQVDPETTTYFSQIANLLDSGEIDLEERYVVCGNALEESRGKEVELSTDHIISHTMQMLLEGCNADHLCSFLRNCAKNFARIATDRCGSHVAETALKSLASHLQDEDVHSLIKDTLTLICEAIVQRPVDVMCSCHGSHVLRSLLCLCKGVPLDSEFHSAKSTSVLARRLNLTSERDHKNETSIVHQGFPDLLEFLVSEILRCSRTDIATLQVDQYSSLVLQTALKLLKGQDQELIHIIPLVMCCNTENAEEENFIEISEVPNIRALLKENAFSHLMEVILEVAPDNLYDEIFKKVFKGSLYAISRDQSANFAVQALVSYARSESQIDAICGELGSKLKDLLEIGRSGVVASLIASSQRLHAHQDKCSKALAAAVISENESPKCIVPRILLLDSYLFSKDKSNWSWTSGCKIHFMGSMILQSLFKYPSEYIEPYITSITSMDSPHVLDMVKDAGGARVLEAFLGSTASDKQKKKLISKLKGHFGVLAMHSSGSFTVDKCFNATDVPLRETIVSELLAVQKELSKTRHGPVLLRNLDVDGFSRRPEQWRSRQKSKLSVYKDFLAEFGSVDDGSSKRKNPPADNMKKTTQQTNLKQMRKEIDNVVASFVAPEASKKHKKSKKGSKNQGDEIVEQNKDKKKRKHHQKDDASKKSHKKLKA